MKILVTLILLFGFFSSNAQISLSSSSSVAEDIESKKYVFIINIGIDSKVKLSVQDSEEVESLGSMSETTPLIDFLTIIESKKATIKPLIVVKANPNLDFGSVVNFIKKIRKIGQSDIILSLSKNISDQYISIPKKTLKKELSKRKPNPLTLVAELKADRKVFLNDIKMGSLYQLDSLENKLKQIFKDRENNGVFIKDTNETVKTVFLKAPHSLQFNEILKIAKVIKGAGANPLKLQMEELN